MNDMIIGWQDTGEAAPPTLMMTLRDRFLKMVHDRGYVILNEILKDEDVFCFSVVCSKELNIEISRNSDGFQPYSKMQRQVFSILELLIIGERPNNYYWPEEWEDLIKLGTPLTNIKSNYGLEQFLKKCL